MNSLYKLAIASALAVALTSSAHAAPIAGTFDFMGGQAFLSTDGIDFLALGGGNGTFLMSNPVCCTFAGMANTPGTIGDTLTSNGRTPGAVLNVANFIAIDGQPDWNFVLNYITPGTHGGGFYSLNQVGNSVFAGIEFRGTAINALAEESKWIASVTTQFTGTNVAAVEALIAAGTAPQNSWSGTFTTTPEPGSIVTLVSGLGLMAVGIARRRK